MLSHQFENVWQHFLPHARNQSYIKAGILLFNPVYLSSHHTLVVGDKGCGKAERGKCLFDIQHQFKV